MNTLKYRLYYLLIGWGTVGIIYELSSTFSGTATVLSPSFLDNSVSFSANSIWLYLSFFLIIPFSYLTASMENVKWMSKCFMALSTCSGLIYFLYPTTMVYPLFENSGLNSFVLEQLIKVDTPKNCLPSLHAGLTTIVVWGLIQIKRPIFSLFMILWGIAICYSILQLKRHLFIDLASGFALALIFGALLKFIHKKNAE